MVPLICVGTALLAGGLVLLELALTRLYAWLHPPTSVFLLVTLAASGLATGGLLAHRIGWHPRRRHGLAAGGAGLAAALGAGAVAGPLLLAWLNAAPVDAALGYLAHVAAGVALAAVYALAPAYAGAVFAAQLAGGGVAAAAAVALFDAVGPVDGGLAAAAAAGGGALCFAALAATAALGRRAAPGGAGAPGPTRLAREPAGRGAEQVEDEEGIDGVRWPWRRFAGLLVPAAGTVLALAAAGSLPLSLARGGWAPAAGSVASAKSLFASVRDPSAGERTVYSVWDGFGRTDVTEPATTSDLKWVYVDGSVAGLMPRADSSTAAAALTADLAYLPFSLPGTRDKVLVIGAGGGQEIAMALAAGAREVVATEASPGVIRAGRRFAAFNGGVFDHPAVRVVNQDGRTYLRSADEQFDVIYVTLAASGVAQPAGTASGRYLYTLEAFGDYLDHLRQDGRLALKVRDEHELTRAFNTAFQALTRRGATPVQAIRRLLAVNDQPLAQRQGVAVALPVLTMRKTPYLEDEARAVFEALRQTPYTPLFVPFLEQLSPLGAFAVEEIGPAAIEAGAPYEIRPASDASPFFFYAGKGPPGLLVIAPVLVLAATGVVLLLARRPGVEAIDPDAAGGVPAEAAAFLEDEVPWRFVGFVALVAAGAELVQLPAIHRLGLLVGEPARSATVALAGLLLGGAAGSVLAQRVAPAALRPTIGWAALGTGLYAVGLLELLPMADVAAAGLAPAGRAAVAAGLIAPLGVGIGVPFPSAVRLLATARRGAWAALLWSVAALAGAVASFVALALGMAWSFTLATALGACCAFGAFMMAGLRLLAADDAAVETPSADGADTARFRRPAAVQD